MNAALMPPLPLPAPTRAALLVRAAALVLMGGAMRLLVFNTSDNAYLYLFAAATLLPPLAVPFLVAALFPAGRGRRVAAQVAVWPVWIVGGMLASMFVLGAVIIVAQLATGGYGPRMFDLGVLPLVAHIAGAALLTPYVLLVNRGLFPAQRVPTMPHL